MSDAGYILGLSLGTTTLGWAAIGLKDGAPAAILGAGTRVFASDGAVVAAGRDVPPNAKRRDARLARRQIARRALRLGKTFRILQRAGLLPEGEAETPWQRDILLKELDARIRQARPPRDRVEGHLLPYLLRAAALDEGLEAHELGRALYHLAQRRGFKSNRKSRAKIEDADGHADADTDADADDAESGRVAAAIHDLREAMTEGGFPTLGSYLASLDPEQQRIRSRWTARQMLEDEFSAIWAAQAPRHPGTMSDELRGKLHRVIFRQRPLKAAKVGRCELEPARPRAAKALLLSQRFRILQTVLTLRVTNTATGEHRSLTEGERATLAKALMVREKLTLERAKSLLKLPADHALDFGREGDTREIRGNTTAAKLIKAIGRDAWDAMPEGKRDILVAELRQVDNEAVRRRRAEQVHGLSPDAARLFAAISLEPGHVIFSTRAVTKLLPLMERGLSLSAAREKAYPAIPSARGGARVHAELPPTKDAEALPWNVNPIVSRSLTELRRVVNAAVRRWGTPTTIRLELSRDLKNTRPQRKADDQSRREEERLRQAAVEQILKETNRAEASRVEPSRSDIERVLLWNECGGTCPFTGRPISFHDLFGSLVDVVHVVPFSRSLDDSLVNKTLRYHDESLAHDPGLTPQEAYQGTAQWDQIRERVWMFRGRQSGRKAELFNLTSEQVAQRLEDLVSRQLDDTRHASRLVGDYLGALYGGRIDTGGRRRVVVGAGRVRALLRGVWDLNGILGEGKGSADHRHHAVDAVVVALTSLEAIRALEGAALEPLENAPLDPPWPAFRAEVADAIGRINVSHAPSRRLSGALHDEMSYRRPLTAEGERAGFVHRRVRVAALTPGQVERIVDPRIQAAVKAGLPEPFMIDKNGRKIPIHSVRVRDVVTTIRIGKNGAEREVATGDNHHVAIVAILDAEGRETRWEGTVVSLFEAQQRLNRRRAARRAKQDALPPIVDYGDCGEGSHRRPKFTLRPGDSVRLGGDINALCVVRSVTDGTVDLFRAEDGRAIQERVRDGGIIRKTPDRLRELSCRKVEIGPLGDERACND